MDYFYIAVAAIGPILLISSGKRFLGSQTHPAAIFILAWMLCTFILTLAEAIPVSRGIISFVWVTICFGVIEIIKKCRGVGSESSAADESSGD